MIRYRKNVWKLKFLLALLIAPATMSWAQQQDSSVAHNSPPSSFQPDAVWQLAREGRFDEGLERVIQSIDEADADSPFASLQLDVAAYQQHRRDRQEQNRAKYEAKLAETAQYLENHELIDALNAAIWAGEVSENPRNMLNLDLIRQLTRDAEIAAKEYESQKNWLRALPIISRLSSLYEPIDRDRYRKDLRRISVHILMLRNYAPDELMDRAIRLAQEEGEDPPQPWDEDDRDSWKQRVAGAELDILFDALHYAALSHVDRGGYQAMLEGGIEQLIILATTGGLSESFEGLNDEQAVEHFVQGLQTHLGKIRFHKEPMKDKDVVASVHRILRLNRDTIQLPETVFIREFGDGAMGQLDDFSSMIWPHDVDRFRRITEQNYTGVGIQIALVEKDGSGAEPTDVTPGIPSSRYRLTVITPLENSPALRAGIHPGDTIVSIDGKSALGVDLETAVDKITGPRGTTVRLGIQSPGGDEVREVELVRSVIEIDSVRGWSRIEGAEGEWDYYIDPDRMIGYVRMSSFGPNTAEELDDAIQSMIKGPGLEGLIFDLRDNGGGRLDAARDVANRFLDQGVIVSTTGTNDTLKASHRNTYPDFPVVILLNERSASASEIVSGALRDHNRALLVGQRSFGKGSVQNVMQLAGQDAYVKVTTQYYQLPKGDIVHRRDQQPQWGVDPDVVVPMTSRQRLTAYQARTLLDILRAEGEQVKPEHVLNLRDDIDEQDKLPPIRQADDLLTHGLDPQLEAALLLIKSKVIATAQVETG